MLNRGIKVFLRIPILKLPPKHVCLDSAVISNIFEKIEVLNTEDEKNKG